jgi:hypothetical protein
MMIRFSTLVFCAGILFGQDNPAQTGPVPPPEVDAALRARITQFYQAHVDGKFRVADQVVAEDSKDAYFAAAKPRYLGFEIVRIKYSDDFTKAEAVVSCKSEWFFHGKKMPVNLPATSTWKIENGLWWWYVVPSNARETPFGTMHFNGGKTEEKGAIPGDPQVLAQQILQSVQVDKKVLSLSGYEPSKSELKITNGMQGSISLRADINGRFPGLTFTLGKTELKAGESTVLTISYEPKNRDPKPSLTAQIYVEPTNQVIPIQLTFSIPPELEKQIPKELRPKPPAQ